ncbi:MAG: hypothetical protein JWQ07_3936 [Ramlibacter sp.]|nr:hypothetical protein [Ramlibacter sp.]
MKMGMPTTDKQSSTVLTTNARAVQFHHASEQSDMAGIRFVWICN